MRDEWILEASEKFYTRDFLADWDYEIGPHTYGQPAVYNFRDKARLFIGDYTAIAHQVSILLGGNHRMDWVTMYPFPALVEAWPEAEGIPDHSWTKGDVVIGNDVWIGNGVTIMSGVTIGDGAVVAARSVVLSDIEPYTVVGGYPARAIKKRFTDTQIELLLEAKWWDWSEDVIRDNVAALCSGDVEAIAELARSIRLAS